MTLCDRLDKRRFCKADVLDALARNRIRRETYKIARMSRPERNADLTVMLHSANPRSMSCPRVDDDDWVPVRITRCLWRRDNSYQTIVYRPEKFAAVDDKFMIEMKNVWNRSFLPLLVCVASLPKNVEKEDGALPCVYPVFAYGAQIRPGVVARIIQSPWVSAQNILLSWKYERFSLASADGRSTTAFEALADRTKALPKHAMSRL